MSTSSIASSASIQTDYMKLLITQLQHQNPFEPLDNNEMSAQLTLLSQLQQLESMGTSMKALTTSFADVVNASNRGYAGSLLGRSVSFLDQNMTTGFAEQRTGVVGEVYEPIEGQIGLLVDRNTVNLKDISNSLIGKEISYYIKYKNGTSELVSGTVNTIYTDIFGQTSLVVDGQRVSWENIEPNSLIGANVSYTVTDETTGDSINKKGMINRIFDDTDGEKLATVGYPIYLNDVISVID